MNSMKKGLAALLCLCLVMLTGCGQSAISESKQNNADSSSESGEAKGSGGGEKTEIVVGRVAPLTGPLAAFANGSPKVEEYAIKSVNEAGGIEVDGEKLPVRFVIADSESDTTKASEAATKLIESEGVDIMITSHTDATTIPVAAACEKAGIVCLSVDTPTEPWIGGGPYQYSYHAGFNTENELLCFYDAWELADTNKTIGIMAANDDEGIVLSTAMTEFAAEKGYTAIDPGKYTSGSNDYTSIIKELKAKNCEVIVGVMLTTDFATFWKQCKENNYQPKICTVAKATLFVEDMLAIGPNGEGDGIISEVWWTANHPFNSSLTGETSQELGAWWCENMNADYAPATMGYKYANVEILTDVLTRAGSLDRDKILTAIEETNLDTCIGNIQYNEDHVSIMSLVTGQWTWDAEAKTYTQEIIANTQIPDLEITKEISLLEE